MPDQGLTEQQTKWMASVRASLPEKTGRSMDDWVEVARTCPETRPRARLAWFKAEHGLGMNYASFVEHELRTRDGGGVDEARDAETLGQKLWAEPAPAEIFRALEAAIGELPDVIVGQRKGYTSFSRNYAFVAARPVKGGQVRIGLALDPSVSSRLVPAARSEGWSERLKASLVLASREEVDADVAHLLRAAWEAS